MRVGEIALLNDGLDFGGRPGVGAEYYTSVLAIPADATRVTFRARARLTDGTWIDAGFDRASLVLATSAPPVPEPAGLALATLCAWPTLLRRRRRL